MGTRDEAPMCAYRNYTPVDEETMCRMPSPTPGPAGRPTVNELETALRQLETAAVNFGQRFIQDAAVRQNYLRQTQQLAQEIMQRVQLNEITPQVGATEVNRLRNQIMEISRLRSSDLGRAIAEALKQEGIPLSRLQEYYAKKLFNKSSFEVLTAAERNQVYLAIIEGSGRPRPTVTARAARIGKLGRGLLVLSIGIAIYNVASAENKIEATGREAAGIGGGILGGAAGGAIAGLACGPGAPVCVTIGVFLGGALGALGVEFAFNSAVR